MVDDVPTSEPRKQTASTSEHRLGEVIRSIDSDQADNLGVLLSTVRPHEAANLLESMPPDARRIVWELLEEEVSHQALQHLHEDVLEEILAIMDTDSLVAAGDELDTDDFADILRQLPDAIQDQVLASLDAGHRQRVESVLSFPEDTAGGLMDTELIAVERRHSLELVLRYLRRRGEVPKTTDKLFVVDRTGKYVGILRVSKLLTSHSHLRVGEVFEADFPAIQADMKDDALARLFAREDLLSAPVIDQSGRLIGRVTVDDVVDVIIEDAEETFMGQAGLEVDQDTFAPILKSTRSRAIWLSINLFTAILASMVISLFEDAIVKVVALAVLMPIVASMGGVAGTQTLTLVIRAMALDQVSRANLGWLLNREIVVAALNGLLLAMLVGIGASLVFADPLLGVVICVAMVANLLIAAVAGTLLPSLLRSLKVDPAIAGGVVLTTITDVGGFFVFLGLATLAYA